VLAGPGLANLATSLLKEGLFSGRNLGACSRSLGFGVRLRKALIATGFQRLLSLSVGFVTKRLLDFAFSSVELDLGLKWINWASREGRPDCIGPVSLFAARPSWEN
jgi:hypothetical protein